jgi:hypothetical protein
VDLHELSATEEINQIEMQRPHVVLLGAGASRAAFPDGVNGKKLPLMADFAQIVPIGDLFQREGINPNGRNFEELYSERCATPALDALREGVEHVIFDYFSSLALRRSRHCTII